MNMTALIAQIIPHAVAVALSPMPIAALILLLLSNKARTNSVMFLLGWMLALIINVSVFAFLANIQQQADHSSKTIVSSFLNASLGIFLLFLAWQQWKSRPKVGEPIQTPPWMQKLESISPLMAFVIAFGLVTINAKNTVLDISTGVMIGQATTTIMQGLLATLIYSCIASVSIAIPVFTFLLMGNRLDDTLQKTKTWFIYNSPVILFVLFLILGIDLLCKAFW